MVGMLNIPPTERQVQVLEAIQAFVDEHGYSPTLRELGAMLGIKSTNGVTEHLNSLVRKGCVAWDRGKSRTIRVIGVQS